MMNAPIGASRELIGYEAAMALCGNDEARQFLADVWNLCEVWDDAVDRESNESEQDINRAFTWALFADENQFLNRHPSLRLVLKQMVAMWMAANALQARGDRASLATAYTLRCSPYLVCVAAVIATTGSLADGARAALHLYGTDSADTLDAFIAEHAKE